MPDELIFSPRFAAASVEMLPAPTITFAISVPADSFPTSRFAMTSERIGRCCHVEAIPAAVCCHWPMTSPLPLTRNHVEPNGAVPEGVDVENRFFDTFAAAVAAASAADCAAAAFATAVFAVP